MKTKKIPFILIIFFLVVFFVFLKGLKNSNIYTPSVDIELDIPKFEAKLFDSDELINSDEIFSSNKFYLMNIWASWCVPCREEHGFLINLSKKKNLEIIGLNYKDKVQNAKSFLNELRNPYNIIITDIDGTLAIDWGAFGVPETFLIYNKKVIKKVIGPLNKDILYEINEIIK
tara:strand:+ start:244 stop:762 length:519 start_codon:yes stop_codon:yes gene_type:complete